MLAAAYCPVCGTTNEPRLFSCKNCGASLALGQTSLPAGPPPATPSPVPPPGATPPAPLLGYREADFGTILGDTLRVFFQSWWAFWLPATALGLFANLGLILFFAAPERAIPAAGFSSSPTLLSISLGDSFGLVLLDLFLGIVGGSILQASLSHYAVRKHRRQEVRLVSAFGRGLGKFLFVLVAAVLLAVLFFLLGVIVGLLVVGSVLLAGFAGLCFGIVILIAFVVGIVIIQVAVSLYAPIIVTEDTGPVESIVRSWELTKGHRWSLFGAYLVLGLIGFAITAGVTLGLAPTLGPLLTVVVGAAASGLVTSWILIAQAVGYSLLAPQARAKPAFQSLWGPVR